MGTPLYQVSKEAQRALEEFSEAFAVAFAAQDVESWAKELGLAATSAALKTTYPVPVSAAGYDEFKGDIKYRSLYQKSLELIPKTWQDGVAELASIVEAPDFIGWPSEPAAIAAAAMALPNEIIAEQLEDNPVCWDAQNYFDTDHPVNVFDSDAGVFVNDLEYSDSTQAGLIEALRLSDLTFRTIPKPSKNTARPRMLGLRLTEVLAPPALSRSFFDVLNWDQLILTNGSGSNFGAVNNPYKGLVALRVCNELTDPDTFYTVARNIPGMHPWIVQDEGSPEEILHDKTSALYKSQLKVGVAYILRGNGKLAMPHAMQRFTLAT